MHYYFAHYSLFYYFKLCFARWEQTFLSFLFMIVLNFFFMIKDKLFLFHSIISTQVGDCTSRAVTCSRLENKNPIEWFIANIRGDCATAGNRIAKGIIGHVCNFTSHLLYEGAARWMRFKRTACRPHNKCMQLNFAEHKAPLFRPKQARWSFTTVARFTATSHIYSLYQIRLIISD